MKHAANNAIAFVVLSAVASTAWADCAGSERAFRTSVVTYYELPDRPPDYALQDPRCSLVIPGFGAPVCRVRLMGVLHEPMPIFVAGSPRAQHPAIVYNHGSGKFKEIDRDTCAVANYFVAKGYVVFFPFRRGNGLENLATRGDPNDRDPNASSTGVNILDAKDAFEQHKPVWPLTTCKTLPCFTVERLKQESADAVEAFQWLRKRSNVNPNAMAIMGNSYGGMMTVLTNTTAMNLSHNATVAFSPGGESWHVKEISEMLATAARSARGPTFYLQAKWDHDTRATVELSREHALGGSETDDLHGRSFSAAIFGFPCEDTSCGGHNQSVHVEFARATEVWGAAVLEFLQRNNVK